MKRPRASGSLWTSEQTVEIFPHFPRIFPHDYLQIHASFCIRLHEAARVAGGRRWLKPVENRASGGEDGIQTHGTLWRSTPLQGERLRPLGHRSVPARIAGAPG